MNLNSTPPEGLCARESASGGESKDPDPGAASDPQTGVQGALARVRGLHHQYRSAGDDTTDYCAHCNQISGGWIPWPCPTIAALGEQPPTA